MKSPLATEVLFHLGPLGITTPVVTTWAIMAVLVALGAAVARRARALPPGQAPGGPQAVAELLVGLIDGQIRETIRAEPARYRAFIGTLFVFILAANWVSLVPGLEPPTANLATDAALALLVFVAIILFALRAGGLRGYLRSFASPTPVMVPLNLLEAVTRSFSLLIRLFGNVMSGVFIIGILLSLAGLLVPIPFMALDLLTGLVQAYIFTVLALVFIGGTIEDGTPPQDAAPGGDPQDVSSERKD